MKIRHPLVIKMLGCAVAGFVRLLVGLAPFRCRTLGPVVQPNMRGMRGRYIYAFWHENLMIPAYHYSKSDIHVLVSQHADGELIAEACRRLGLRIVRGSTTRGGAEAIRQMVRLVKSGQTRHLVVTPDGPRGPRRKVHPGLVYLAARTGLPIVPLAIGFQRAWRMNSWDRLAVPYPGSLTACVMGEPIHVPENIRKEELETYRLRVEEAMHHADEVAERLAGVRPRPRENAQARNAA